VKLSIIIPCYNAADTLGDQLEALALQEWDQPWEVVIADNGSQDASRSIVEHYRDRLPALQLVDASQRKGGAYARNQGVRAARGEWLAFVDADDMVAPGWIAAIGAALEQHAFVASRFEMGKLNRSADWAKEHPQSEGLQRIGYPPYLLHSGGCGLGIHRRCHEQVGGFDESLMRLMDTDYCFRVQLMCDVELTFVSAAVVHIRERGTLRSLWRQTRERAAANVLLAARYHPAGKPRQTLQRWYRLIRRLLRTLGRGFKVRSRPEYIAWIRVLAWNLGLAQGGLKYRVPPL
jgi:glycosyltransferase involved in cell wall biosynthesis